MQIPEVSSILSAVTTAMEISASILQRTRDVHVRAKVIELQGIISDLQGKVFSLQSLVLSLQKENMELENKIEDLEEQIVEQQQWNETKRRYKLVSLGAGSQAYLYQPEEGDETPVHYLCANCFSRRKHSFLQKTGYSTYGAVYKCFACGTEVIDPSDKPPSTDPVVKLRKPFSGF